MIGVISVYTSSRIGRGQCVIDSITMSAPTVCYRKVWSAWSERELRKRSGRCAGRVVVGPSVVTIIVYEYSSDDRGLQGAPRGLRCKQVKTLL